MASEIRALFVLGIALVSFEAVVATHRVLTEFPVGGSIINPSNLINLPGDVNVPGIPSVNVPDDPLKGPGTNVPGGPINGPNGPGTNVPSGPVNGPTNVPGGPVNGPINVPGGPVNGPTNVPGAPIDPPGVKIFDITKYGAKGNGKQESAMSIIRAWLAACQSTGPVKLLIPPGDFMVGEVVFQGPCTATPPIVIEIQGNLVARTDLSLFTQNTWIYIEHVNGVSVTGSGTINGQGEASWKFHDGGSDSHLPDSLVFMGVNDTSIENVRFLNSKGYHMKINNSNRVRVNRLTITAPGDSPNTDGIHISGSTDINITSTIIGTGDDCISIGEGNTNVLVKDVTCGPGHGISIGSLGKRDNEENLQNVLVTNCTLVNTTNGARIKTYRDSIDLLASSIVFEDIIMHNVKNPIIIDQSYASKTKKNPSKVKLHDVHFRNIRGTTISEIAVTLNCSALVPCKDVEVADIDLSLVGPDTKPVLSICSSAFAIFKGKKVDLTGCT